MSDDFDQLTPEQQLFARTMFQNRVCMTSGQQFEDLFTDVMSRCDPRFHSVKPQGPIGDQGNDGYIPEEGRYFQVFSPQEPHDTKSKVDAAKKAKDNFTTLKTHWDSDFKIVDFRFVFNDKYLGPATEIEHVLNDIKNNHSLQVARAFLARDLEREFMKLPISEMQAVLQTVIPRPEHIDDIDYAALTDVLQHIVDNQQPVSDDTPPDVRDFVKKIEFNSLDAAGSLLIVGNFQNAAVDTFFDRHGEFTKTDIRNRLANSYESSLINIEEVLDDEVAKGDRVFFDLLNRIAPDASKLVQDAAIVLIAYFFEKCDVFEDPNT